MSTISVPMIDEPQPIETGGIQKKARTDDIPLTSEEEQPKPTAGKVRRIRLFPTTEQRKKLVAWFGTARWTYNKCLELVKADRTKLKKGDLRTAIVNNANYETTNTWVCDTPYDVRDGAMIDLVNAYASNFAKKRKGKTALPHFSLKYRSRKQPAESIYIRGRLFKHGRFYPTYLGKEPMRSAEPLPDSIEYDCRLVRTRLGQYYICIPQPLAVASDNQAPTATGRVASLDPGVRTFQTLYDPSGYALEVGKGDMGHIVRLCSHMDKLQSKAALKTTSHRSRRHMHRAGWRLQGRVRNLVDELHKKLSTFLVRNYSTVLLPTFETSQMVGRAARKIDSKTVRSMLTWSHYRFKQRLLNKTREYTGCKVIIVDESYTSKTCGQCGRLHESLGSNKIFRCPSCRVVMDRDLNAARNILLKNSSQVNLCHLALGPSPTPLPLGGGAQNGSVGGSF